MQSWTVLRRLKIPTLFPKKGESYNEVKQAEQQALANSLDESFPNPLKTDVPKRAIDGSDPVKAAFYKHLPERAFSEDKKVMPPTFHNRRKLTSLFRRMPEPPELDIAPTPQPTHLANYTALCDYIDSFGDRWKYPEGILITFLSYTPFLQFI